MIVNIVSKKAIEIGHVKLPMREKAIHNQVVGVGRKAKQMNQA